MHGYVGLTDYDWFTYLRSREPDEVNFWQPGGGRGFQAIRPGEPFFFKLKKPHYKIAGFAIFARHELMPAWLAWDCFGDKNGAPARMNFLESLSRYRREDTTDPAGRYQIGCILLTQPVFFPESHWVDAPNDWDRNIVSGKTYDVTAGEGLRVFEACARAASLVSAEPMVAASANPDRRHWPGYGAPVPVRPRLGQGTFRVAVTSAYERACAITSEHSLPVLEAAHIKPYAVGGPHEVANGLALRADLHRLFDQGYLTVTPEHRVEVSGRLREEFNNGKLYYPLHGASIVLPRRAEDRPDPALLSWHNENVYRG